MISTIFPSAREEKTGDTHISAPVQWYVYPPASATTFQLCMLFDSCLNPCCVTSCVRWYRRYFLQQENKKTGDTHISALVQWYVRGTQRGYSSKPLNIALLNVKGKIDRSIGINYSSVNFKWTQVFLCYQSFDTLGARNFSCAVSGFGQVSQRSMNF